ncbi:uncharacterized protein LOC111134027 [Crassostrea virginica]
MKMLYEVLFGAVSLFLLGAASELHGKYLSGFTFRTLGKMGKQMCVRECKAYRGGCGSVNFDRENLSCELNSNSSSDTTGVLEDRLSSIYIQINNSESAPNCGVHQCSTGEKCIPTHSGHKCVFMVCNVPKMKNVEYNGGRLSFRNYLQCQSGYRNLTSLKCEESGLEKSPAKFKCYKEMDGWILIYRGQGGGNESDYLSFISTGRSDEADESVNDEHCASIVKSAQCTTNYRTSLIDDWESVNITQVQVRLYKNGVTVSEVIFNGTDSNMNSWFSPSRILSSTWSDVTPSQTYNVFNMEGHVQQGGWRNFQIWKSYGGCPNDIFWMTSSYALPGTYCPIEATSTKQYFYCNQTTLCQFELEHDIADVMTVSIKVSE